MYNTNYIYKATNKYTANWNILIPLREVLPIARHYGSIKFAKIEAIFITTLNHYFAR